MTHGTTKAALRVEGGLSAFGMLVAGDTYATDISELTVSTT